MNLNDAQHLSPAPRLDAAWLEPHWMPYTGNRDFKANPRMMVSAEGCYYTDANGRRIFDGLSGLWCCGLGHARPEITEAVSRQIGKLDYSPAFQYGHPLSFELANKIKELTPEGLDYVFFTGSGSECADTSLKMARAYWRAKGQASKTRFIGREKGYHGVNFGGISVGGIVANRKAYGQAVEADHLPHTLLAGNAFTRGMPATGVELADDLLRLINLHDASNIAAVIVEPMSGSAGVIIPPVGYLQRLREICTAHNILLIFDEVITGFGRCGAFTGSEAFGVTPDILNAAKQITNGTQPLGAVVAKKEIYDTFMAAGGPDYMLEFVHGYTYSAHPVACAAARNVITSLASPAFRERAEALGVRMRAHLEQLQNAFPQVIGDVRGLGPMLAIELVKDPASREPDPDLTIRITRATLERGLITIRAGLYSNCIRFLPPLTLTKLGQKPLAQL